jgi:alkylation response protein AidB-like acyl-CoA dehydrogenase
MRAKVSYMVRFDDVCIPEEDVIGRSGQYLQEGWQTRFSPHYAATFLGGAEAAYDQAGDLMTAVQTLVAHRIAQMSLDIETAHLWLKHVAELWDYHRIEEAKAAAPKVRYLVEKLATETLDHCIRACRGARLLKPSPVERIYRDLSLYVRHDNADQGAGDRGQAIARERARSLFFQ